MSLVSAVGSQVSGPCAALDQRCTQGASCDDEAALIARLRANDEQAFELVVRTCGPRMLSTARRLLGSEEDAADAVQEAFISAFKGIDSFERTSRLSTWLHRITINASLMKLRSRRRRDEVSIESMLPTFAADGHRNNPQPAWPQTPEELLERRETCQMVRDKIAMLPDDHRTVLILRDIEELDTAETARVLGINPGAVKTRLHRARMALRGLLDADLSW